MTSIIRTFASFTRRLPQARAFASSSAASSASSAASPAYFDRVDASQLVVTKTSSPKPLPKPESLKFGHEFSDYMLEVDWVNGRGWTAPRISPLDDLRLHPAASSLHYGLQCFEGMKAYVDSEDRARLFRPMKNMERMNTSMQRLMMPSFDKDNFLECLRELIRLEKRWIPKLDGYSLYIRPTAISTHPFLGVASPGQVKMFVILSPVGPYYPEGFKPVSLLADPQYIRAWPGGVGNIKCGGNYALSIRPAADAAAQKYSQVMWLYGDDHQVTEVGTMNQFFFWKRESDGKPELVTAPLDGTILPGVTRDSILTLAREWGEFEVSERTYTMKEVVKAIDEGRLLEAFGAGTAAIVSPVERIGYLGKDYTVPLDPDNKEETAGPLTRRVAKTIMDIQYGRVEHEWSEIL